MATPVSKDRLGEVTSYLESTVQKRYHEPLKAVKSLGLFFYDLVGRDSIAAGVYEVELQSGKRVFLSDAGRSDKKFYEHEFPNPEMISRAHCYSILRKRQIFGIDEKYWQERVNALGLPDEYKEKVEQELKEECRRFYIRF